MPNGFHAVEGDLWEKTELPLREVDSEVEAFARAHGMTVSKNDRSWPSRFLRWQKERRIAAQIEVSLADAKTSTYSIIAYAWTDARGKRQGKIEALRKGSPWAEIRSDFPQLLQEAYTKVQSWKQEDFVTLSQVRSSLSAVAQMLRSGREHLKK